jgi:prolycopene isomerase
VTTSGLSAANAVLKKSGLVPFIYQENAKNYVSLLDHPFTLDMLYSEYPKEQREIMLKASKCQYCEKPTCSEELDIRGIMRRVSVGNFIGARKIVDQYSIDHMIDSDFLSKCESCCVKVVQAKNPVEISSVIDYIKEKG